MRLHAYRWHLALSLVVVAIGVASMPRWFYRGDPRAVRFGTAELIEHCKAAMAEYKRPRWIEYVDELPKTATGKIQRFRLRS